MHVIQRFTRPLTGAEVIPKCVVVFSSPFCSLARSLAYLIAITCNMNKPMSKCTLHLLPLPLPLLPTLLMSPSSSSHIDSWHVLEQHTSILLFMILFLLFVVTFIHICVFCLHFSSCRNRTSDWVCKRIGMATNHALQFVSFVAPLVCLISMFFGKLWMSRAAHVGKIVRQKYHTLDGAHRIFGNV